MHYLTEWQDTKFYLIDAGDHDKFADLIALHNATFPAARSINPELLQQRLQNGFCIAGYSNNELQAMISGFVCDQGLIDTKQTWAEFTSNGSLANRNPDGDIVLLTAVSSKTSANRPDNRAQLQSGLPPITDQMLAEYVASGKDYVARFHNMPKAGLAEGAKVIRLIADGNPQDEPSLGYIVIYEYPDLGNLDFKFTAKSVGVAVAEAAFFYAQSIGKHRVMALSRCGELNKHYSAA